jgi:ATP-binding cassette, subfamily B, bacterial
MQISLRHYWRLLHTYLRAQWTRVLLLALLLAGAIGLQLYTPRLLQRFVDAALAGAPASGLLWPAALFLTLALLGLLLQVVTTAVSQEVGWRATNQLRADLLMHVLSLDLSFHKALTPGELMERIDGDVTTLANFFAQFTVQVAGNAVLLAGVLAVVFTVDWRAGLALTGFAAVNLAVLLRTRNAALPGWQQARQSSAEYFGYLGERLTGLEDLRANGAEAHTLRGLVALFRRRLQAEQLAGRGMAVTLVASFGLIALGMSTAFTAGAYLVGQGAITVGTAYMLFYYTEQLRRPVEQLISQMQDLARASAAIGRTSELLDLRATVTDGPGAPLPPGPLAVEADSLSFSYGSTEPVLRQISFTLQPGQVLGLLGRTGSGKSTLARLVARLYDPDQGAVRLSGVPLPSVRLADLHRRVGVVTQEVHLFQGTLRDNLTFYDPTIADSQVWEALREVGLYDWAASLPNGLQTELAGAGGLSAGEAQLLAFARILLQDPGLVILDEASARLDPVTELRLERAIDRLLASRTAIIIAHRLRTLQRADFVLVLEGGAVVEQGARAALAADPTSRFHHLLQTGAKEALA